MATSESGKRDFTARVIERFIGFEEKNHRHKTKYRSGEFNAFLTRRKRDDMRPKECSGFVMQEK